jgi:anti-sigma-K factor RskA
VLRAIRDEPNVSGHARVRLGVGWRWLVCAPIIAAAIALHFGDGPGEQVLLASLGRARVRIDGDRGELVIARLPALPPSRVYELWLQTKGTPAPTPSTLFGVTSRGGADLGLPGGVHGLARVLVTVEPVGGSRHPTTRPVIVAPLSE